MLSKPNADDTGQFFEIIDQLQLQRHAIVSCSGDRSKKLTKIETRDQEEIKTSTIGGWLNIYWYYAVVLLSEH